MDFLIDRTLEAMLIFEQRKRVNKKLEYYIYHAQRCKKEEDRNKLIALTVVEIFYLKSILTK